MISYDGIQPDQTMKPFHNSLNFYLLKKRVENPTNPFLIANIVFIQQKCAKKNLFCFGSL